MQLEAETASAPARNGIARDTSSLIAALKEKLQRAVASGLYHAGLLPIARCIERTHEVLSVGGSRLPRLRRTSVSKFGILCYHRVGTEGVPFFSRLAPAVFEAQMRYLKNNYRIVSLGQLCRELQEGNQVRPTLAITFDDGYRDLYTHAFLVLQKYEIPATIYLIGRSMETGEAPWYDRIFAALGCASVATLDLEMGTPRQFTLSTPALRASAAWEIVCYLRSIPDSQRQKWCSLFEQRISPPADQLEGRILSWEHVRAMQRGGVSFGAHTMTHPSVSRLEPSAFHEEFVVTKQLLEDGLGAPVEDFAYPFGRTADVSSEARDFLARSGYRSAVTTMEGFNSLGRDLHMLNRLQIGDDQSMSWFAFAVARMFLEARSDSHSKCEVSVQDRQNAQAATRRSDS
jgi:peptidoglycan/xylan/chitin deacetylase (PgdA/CDA1 family)